MKLYVVFIQVWRQKAQYLQHKQNKAEATTVKNKSTTDNKPKGIYKPVWNNFHRFTLSGIAVSCVFHSSYRNKYGALKQDIQHGVLVSCTSPRS